MRGDLPEVERLLANGADVNNADKSVAVLMAASSKGDREVVQALMAKGAEVNAKGKDGWTALHLASANGDLEVAPPLLPQTSHPSR